MLLKYKILLVFVFGVLSFVCQPYYFHQDIDSASKAKTQQIALNKNNTTNDTICVLPVQIEWRFYPYWSLNRIDNKEGFKYLKLHSTKTTTYGTLPNLESMYSNKFYWQVKKNMQKQNMTVVSLRINPKDSAKFVKCMREIEIELNSNDNHKIKLGDTLIRVLNSLNKKIIFFYKLDMFHGEYLELNSWSLYCFQRVYVLNLETKELVFYKCKKSLGGADSRNFWLPLIGDRSKRPYLQDKFPNVKRFIKPSIRFLKTK